MEYLQIPLTCERSGRKVLLPRAASVLLTGTATEVVSLMTRTEVNTSDPANDLLTMLMACPATGWESACMTRGAMLCPCV
jgi:hypothetical protein